MDKRESSTLSKFLIKNKMSETTNPENRSCKICGKPVIDMGNGEVVHSQGGTVEQRCRSCGWGGGQVGKFTNCPRCGDATNLSDDHIAQ